MKRIILFIILCVNTLFVAQAQSQTQKSTSIVTIGGVSYYVHTVRAGDTFYSLSKIYNTDEEAIHRNNPHVAEGLQTDQVIKIPVVRESEKQLSDRKKKRLFDIHTVNQGETAYSITKRYGIALDILMEDNEGFDPTRLSIGQQINIRKASQGQSDPAEIEGQIESYKEALNSVSEHFTHHIVEKGETLYSLGKRFNLPVDSITIYNEPLLKEGLKVGSILRIPIPAPVQVVESAQDTTIHPSSLFPTSPRNGTVKAIDITAPIRVAVLLPLQVNGSLGRQFLEFYQGVLLALEELKEKGISTKVDLFNTGKSPEETAEILQQPLLQQADLLIGPVYDESYPPVAAFAAQHGIPVVSPLAAIESVNNSLLFQVAPSSSGKNDKLRGDLSEAHNVIVISSGNNDAEFSAEIQPLLPKTAHRLNYTTKMSSTVVEGVLSADKENVIVILSSNETTTTDILAYISTVQNNLTSRSISTPVIRVIGSSRWTRFQDVEKDLFFKLNLRYITSYHADRSNERVAQFDRKYITAFNSLPSLYSYRGYDVTKLFVSSIKLHGSDFAAYLNQEELPLLQTPYRFVQKAPEQKYENNEWALVCYKNDYTIEVK